MTQRFTSLRVLEETRRLARRLAAQNDKNMKDLVHQALLDFEYGKGKKKGSPRFEFNF